MSGSWIRSIPAGAGEPETALARKGSWPVYPRGCGGTSSMVLGPSVQEGLSPRVRGNPADIAGHAIIMWSIPAGAGEPWSGSRGRWGRTVYPRGCGGTVIMSLPSASSTGLSPRVRGNPLITAHGALPNGSIPAGAGEPPNHGPRRVAEWVYPRGCGGTP